MLYLLCIRDITGEKARLAHAGHYLGYGETMQKIMARVIAHRLGRARCKFTKAVVSAGLFLELATVFEGGRDRERQLKRWKNGPKLCPFCTPPIRYRFSVPMSKWQYFQTLRKGERRPCRKERSLPLTASAKRAPAAASASASR